MDWKDKNVLVTGSEGFIGSHLVEALVKLGAKVTALVKNNFQQDLGFIDEFKLEIAKKIRIRFADLNDCEAVKNAVSGNAIVFNLAAEISIPYSYENPRTFLHTNVVGTFNILSACRESKIERFIQMSTSEVYGTPDKIPINEGQLLKGQSPYSASKIAAEKLVESFCCSYKLPAVIVRAFNTYGPRQSARAIIPAVITQALFKNEIFIGNTKPTRDFNFVTDVVGGLIKIAECSLLIGEVVNIGTGKEISVGELLKKIILLTGSNAKPVQETKRFRPSQSEIMRLCADNSKVKKYTDWRPLIDLDHGLEKTIRWIKDNPRQFKIGEYEI